MLRFYYTSESDVPSDHKSLYSQKEIQLQGNKKITAWVLNVEGAVAIERFHEFRDNNISLNSELTALKAKVGDLDLDKAKVLMQKASDLEDEKLMKKDQIDEIVTKRTKTMVEAHTKALETEKATNAALTKQLTDLLINKEVVQEATKHKLLSTAVLDIQGRARQVFTVKDGKVVALEADGRTPKYNKGGTAELDITEWVKELTAEAPHLFEGSSGSGAPGSGSGGTPKVQNPWKKDTFNITEQMKMQRANPSLAARLKAEAGAKQ